MSLDESECELGLTVQYGNGVNYSGLTGFISRLNIDVDIFINSTTMLPIVNRYFVQVMARDGYPYVVDVKYLNKYKRNYVPTDISVGMSVRYTYSRECGFIKNNNILTENLFDGHKIYGIHVVMCNGESWCIDSDYLVKIK